MRTFDLQRDDDETGISGTGVVAQGIEFDDGSVAMKWLTDTASLGYYDSIDELVIIHGHGGRTFPVFHSNGLTQQDKANIWIEGWYHATNGKWDFPDKSECPYGPWDE